jgi:hypothetical protein
MTIALRGLLAALVLLAVIPVATPQAAEVTSAVETTLWGRAVFNIHFDTDELRTDTDFATFIATKDRHELNFNPRDTRLGFRASYGEGAWKTSGVFEIDFYGSNAANNLLPRLRLGYAEMVHPASGFSVRAGQDWTPVGQLNPHIIDFGLLAWGGNLWWRVPQLTVRYKTGNVELLASGMKHRNIDLNPNPDDPSPWFLGRVAYTNFLHGKGLVALGGGTRWQTVGGEDLNPFLICGEADLPFTETFSIIAEVFSGEGIGGDFIRYGLDYNTVAGKAIPSIGGFVSAGYKATPRLSFGAGYGLDDPDEDEMVGMAATTPFQRNQVVFANAKFAVNKYAGLGLELMNFTTEKLGGTEITGQRITSSWWFAF